MFGRRTEQDTPFLYQLAREARRSELVAYLKRGKTPVVRRRAAELLGDLADSDVGSGSDDEVVQALVGAVTEEEDDSVRARAIDALFRYGQDSLERLVDEMGTSDAVPGVAGSDVEAGSGDGAAAEERTVAGTFKDWLDADYPEFRMVAATALGRIGGEEVLGAVVGALTDSNSRVRVRAVRACGRIDDPRCIPALQERLEDPDQSVRRATIDALGSIGTREALSALVPVVRVDEEPLRRAAVEELGQYGNLEPVVVLLRAIEDDTPAVKRAAMFSLLRLFVDAPEGERREARDTVARQLSAADTGTVVPPLIDVLTESGRPPVRRNAAWLLGRVADADPDSGYRDDVYDCLIETLDAPDDATAEIAADSLAELGSGELERRLHVFAETAEASDDAADRARSVIERIDGDLSREVVTNAVDYTYVRDPADYTEQKREAESTDNDGAEVDGGGTDSDRSGTQ
jgi:HEAT repeat protein